MKKTDKNIHEERLKKIADKLSVQIGSARDSINRVEENAKEEYNEKLDYLISKKVLVENKLKEVQISSEEKLAETKSSIENSVNAVISEAEEAYEGTKKGFEYLLSTVKEAIK